MAWRRGRAAVGDRVIGRRLTVTASFVTALVAPMALPGAVAMAQPVVDGQWWHQQWRMDEVWQIADGSGVTVAVLDSGVEAGLPDLAGAVVPGNDYLGDTDGRSDYDSDDGHGTAMASLITADGNGTGIRGVAPAATILPVVVLDGSRPSFSDDSGEFPTDEMFGRAIEWAVDQGADVINMSIGAPGPLGCQPRIVAGVRYALEHEVIVVAAGGNQRGGDTEVPANCPGVLTVGATDSVLEPWEDSHRGEFTDVTGPGVYIASVNAAGQVRLSSGTSDASALVSGAIALVRSEFPDATADEVLRRIFATARDLPADAPDGWDEATGYGIVRPYHALTEQVPPDAPNPVFEELAEAAASATPDSAAPEMLPTDQAAPAPDGDDGPPALLWVVLAVGALLLLGAATAVVVLLVRRSPTG